MDFIGALIGAGASLASSALSLFGGREQQKSANEAAASMSALDWQRSQQAATTAWERSQQAATTQHERSQQDAAIAYERSKEATLQQQEASERYAQAANARSVHNYQHRYQWTVNDMRAAGLNPILAASGGFSVGNSPASPAAHTNSAQVTMANAQMARVPQATSSMAKTFMHPVKVSDLSQSAKNVYDSMKSSKEIEKKDAEIENLEANTAYTAKKTKHEIHKILETRVKTGKAKTEEKVAYQKIFTLEKQREKINAELDMLEVKFRSEQATIHNKKKTGLQILQQIERLKENTKNLRYQNIVLERVSDAYKGKLGPLLGYSKAINDSISLKWGFLLKGLLK